MVPCMQAGIARDSNREVELTRIPGNGISTTIALFALTRVHRVPSGEWIPPAGDIPWITKAAVQLVSLSS